MEESWWQELPARVPVVNDRSLVHLVNSLRAADDLTSARSDSFFTRVLGVLAGRDAARLQLASEHLAGAQAVLVQWVESLTGSATVSNLAVIQAQRHLIRIKDTVERHEEELGELLTSVDSMIASTNSRLADLESRVSRLEATETLNQIIDAWHARQTYQRLPWPVAIALLCCQAADQVIALSELSGGQSDYALRHNLVNKICIAAQYEHARNWFPLAGVLTATSHDTRDEDRELVIALAQDPTSLGRLRRHSPYLFTVWSALVTAIQAPQLDPGKAAIARCRSQVAPISQTSDMRRLVTHLANEAVDSAVTAYRAAARSAPGAQGASTQRAPAQRVRRGAFPDPVRRTLPQLVREPTSRPKIGLVLSGGGARGGYEVGVLEYLAEAGIEPDIITGASIGALNGAVISAAGDLPHGVLNLRAAWEEMCTDDAPPQSAPAVAGADRPEPSFADRLSAFLASTHHPVLDRLDEVVRKWAPLPELRRGIELWVTIFAATQGRHGIQATGWLWDLIDSRLGGEADWLCVQHAGEQAQELVLASAAIPGVLPPRTVDSLPFRDGGLANNVPVEPLAERDCHYAIVVHLAQRHLFNSHKFPDLEILEIRPRRPLAADDGLGQLESLLDFSRQGFDRRRRQGYDDARHMALDIMSKHQLLRAHFSSMELLTATTDQLGAPDL
jgi:NTE family protein